MLLLKGCHAFRFETEGTISIRDFKKAAEQLRLEGEMGAMRSRAGFVPPETANCIPDHNNIEPLITVVGKRYLCLAAAKDEKKISKAALKQKIEKRKKEFMRDSNVDHVNEKALEDMSRAMEDSLYENAPAQRTIVPVIFDLIDRVALIGNTAATHQDMAKKQINKVVDSSLTMSGYHITGFSELMTHWLQDGASPCQQILVDGSVIDMTDGKSKTTWRNESLQSSEIAHAIASGKRTVSLSVIASGYSFTLQETGQLKSIKLYQDEALAELNEEEEKEKDEKEESIKQQLNHIQSLFNIHKTLHSIQESIQSAA